MPASALIAVVVVSKRAGTLGAWLALLGAVGFFVVSLDVDVQPRLQRSNWRGVADVLRASGAGGAAGTGVAGGGTGGALAPAPSAMRALVTIELGSAPFEYYLPVVAFRPRPLRQGARSRRGGVQAAARGRRRAPRGGVSPVLALGHRRADPVPLRLAGPPDSVGDPRCTAMRSPTNAPMS